MKYSIKKYDNIIVTNKRESNILMNNYGNKNVIIIPNGIDLEKFNQLSNIDYINQNKFTVTYIGNIGIAQNLQILLEVARDLRDINFLIIGDGIEKISLEKYVSNNDLKNVHFTGKINWKKLEYYYQQSSVLYAQLGEEFAPAVPSKLYEYASTGLPIIYGGVGEGADFTGKLEHSFVIKPNDKEELINVIKKISLGTFDISKNNINLIGDFYIRDNTVKKLLDIIF